jgi:radical SAM superfamily enzyme YgiQ (UPF0313 family)
MKVLLVVPPFHEEGVEMDSKESIGVCYLAALLREENYQVSLLDADLLKLSSHETIQRICSDRHDLIGFSLLEGTIESTVDILKGVREQGVGSHIVLGGYFPTLVTEKIMQELPEVDSIIRGEGEVPLLELARCLSGGKDWRDIRGMAYRHNDRIVINENSPLENLDILPFPVRDLLPEVLERRGVTGIVASRGCYANCSFCCVNSFGRASSHTGWRGRSPVNIADEIQMLTYRFGIDMFSFYDSNFIGPGERGRQRVFEFAEELARRNLNIRFALSTRPDQIETELFRFLKKAGLTEVFIGIESMSQKSLDLYNKKVTVEQNRRAIEILEELEIFYRPGFILYEPYITLEQIRENLDFLRELVHSQYCNKYHFFKGLRIYRGSPLEKDLLEKGMLIENGWHYSYRWQDPRVARFISLAGVLGSKMLSLMEKKSYLTNTGKQNLDRLLGEWSINVYEDIFSLIESDSQRNERFMDIFLKADKKLERIEKAVQIFSC